MEKRQRMKKKKKRQRQRAGREFAEIEEEIMSESESIEYTHR
jgi:hypothetical protein